MLRIVGKIHKSSLLNLKKVIPLVSYVLNFYFKAKDKGVGTVRGQRGGEPPIWSFQQLCQPKLEKVFGEELSRLEDAKSFLLVWHFKIVSFLWFDISRKCSLCSHLYVLGPMSWPKNCLSRRNHFCFCHLQPFTKHILTQHPIHLSPWQEAEETTLYAKCPMGDLKLSLRETIY